MATENDIVLIYFEDRPLTFARIESILPDSKPDWYHVELLMLQVPHQTVSWILRNAYINGDPFTMNGKNMRLELIEKKKPVAVMAEAPKPIGGKAASRSKSSPTQAKVISFKELKDRNG